MAFLCIFSGFPYSSSHNFISFSYDCPHQTGSITHLIDTHRQSQNGTLCLSLGTTQWWAVYHTYRRYWSYTSSGRCSGCYSWRAWSPLTYSRWECQTLMTVLTVCSEWKARYLCSKTSYTLRRGDSVLLFLYQWTTWSTQKRTRRTQASTKIWWTLSTYTDRGSQRKNRKMRKIYDTSESTKRWNHCF